MSAFQSYSGAYEFGGGDFAWRCYATARIYDVRRSEHAPLPSAPQGRKWLVAERTRHAPDVCCLVDDAVNEFSHILLQVEMMPRLCPESRPAVASA